ncbi:MAG: ribokinase [Propionibacteriaceae bacterium]|nr:ribokinase [Propionibacteriaceae bacterium]
MGSVNIDSIHRVDHLPRPGETVSATSWRRALGGKGANQAAAAAKIHSGVAMIAAVGLDEQGQWAVEHLVGMGVDTAGILALPNAPTGTACVAVDPTGENLIIVSPGANSCLDASWVADHWADTSVVVMPGEVATPLIDRVAALAQGRDQRFVLNLAPVSPVARATLAVCDPLVVNELEAGLLADRLGMDPPDSPAQTADMAHAWVEQGLVRSVVVTLGSDGALGSAAEGTFHWPAPLVSVAVDTTGAGDACVGTLAARIAGGADLVDALAWGVCAGSLAVTRAGAASSYADAAEVARVRETLGTTPVWIEARP